MGLDVSEFPNLSEEEIKARVNAGLTQVRRQAIMQIIDASNRTLTVIFLYYFLPQFQLTNPIRTKEALVDQLKTQIIDLERFIDFLHGMSLSIIQSTQII